MTISEHCNSTILVIDDDPMNMGIIVEPLQAHGFRVAISRSGESGLKRANHLHPDLILLDVQMPHIDGFETCRRLKANDETKDIPIIFLTAHTETTAKVKGFAVGGVDFITKPFQMEEVLARVKTHLTLQKIQQHLKEQNTQLQAEIVHRKQLESALRESQKKLQRLASLDGLTQIPNRRRFDDYLQQCWQDGLLTQQPLGLLMADVDHFKQYNDNYGHLAGDDVLKLLAATLEQTVKRNQDLTARYGGEEFSIILPNTEIAGGVTVAKQIQHNIEALKIPHQFSVTSAVVTMSIGVAALIPNPSLQPEDLIDLADKALYKAKNAGRNQVVALSSSSLKE